MLTAPAGAGARDVRTGERLEMSQASPPPPMHRPSRRWERTAAASIVLCATLLCAFWSLRVPMFQEPDEIAHADAAFAYFDAGKPFVVANPDVANFVTRQARYLMDATNYRELRYDNHASARHGYGTVAYFQKIDARAPQPTNATPRAGARVPYALAFYPSTYYYFVAAAMRIGWDVTAHSLSAAFFAGRLLNVALFAATLALAFLALSEMPFTPAQRLMVLAGIAFFPLSTWMGAYIQPDNATALLVTASLLATLVVRKYPRSVAALVFLAAAESALGLTKLQYALVAIVAFGFAVFGTFSREPLPVRLRAFGLGVAIPSVVAYLGRYLSPIGTLNAPPSGMAYEHAGLVERLRLAGTDLLHSATGALLGGQTFAGFWFHFGLRSGGVFPSATEHVVASILAVLTTLTCAAWLIAQLRLAHRLRRVGERYGFARAWRFLGTDPALNLYVLLSALLLGVSAFTGGDLMLQGRYWYPVLLPIVILSVRSIGAACPRAHARVATSIACAFWLCYSAIGAPSAVVAMERDFYHARDALPTHELGEVESISVDGRVADRQNLTLPAGSILTVRGNALDTSAGLPASDVRFRVDGGLARRATVGLPDRTLVVVFNDQLLARAGFRFELDTHGLEPGSHDLSIAAYEKRAPQGLPIETVPFVVLAETRR